MALEIGSDSASEGRGKVSVMAIKLVTGTIGLVVVTIDGTLGEAEPDEIESLEGVRERGGIIIPAGRMGLGIGLG